MGSNNSQDAFIFRDSLCELLCKENSSSKWVVSPSGTQNKLFSDDDATFGLFVSMNTEGGAFRFAVMGCGLLVPGLLLSGR